MCVSQDPGNLLCTGSDGKPYFGYNQLKALIQSILQDTDFPMSIDARQLIGHGMDNSLKLDSEGKFYVRTEPAHCLSFNAEQMLFEKMMRHLKLNLAQLLSQQERNKLVQSREDGMLYVPREPVIAEKKKTVSVKTLLGGTDDQEESPAS